MIRRTALGLLALAAAATAPSLSSPATAGAASPPPPPAAQVLAEDPPIAPATPEQAEAWHQARRYAEENGQALGHPYIDRQTGELVLPSVSAAGEAVAKAGVAGGRIRRVPVSYRRAQRSYAALEQAKHEAIDLAAPTFSSIWSTSVDAESGRLIVRAENPSPELLTGLAAKFGPDAVAVVAERNPRVQPRQGGRSSDRVPFYGGAVINGYRYLSTEKPRTCTSAFAYKGIFSGEPKTFMSTAGHCYNRGAAKVTSGTPGYLMGTLTDGLRENWVINTGTVAFSSGALAGGGYSKGPRTMMGDIGLINTSSDGRRSAGYIYTSALTAEPVRRARFNYPGHQYCISGRRTGQLCHFKIKYIEDNFRMPVGWGFYETIRNAALGVGPSSKGCQQDGDSGAPVYNANPDPGTGVEARGIFSSGGASDGVCTSIFTDVWRPTDAWGVSLITVN